MLLMGLAYMIFGVTITDGIPANQTLRSALVSNANTNIIAKSLVGVQVGLIGLAMYVTSSSLRSLQAKQGLPLGNQIIGWAVLGTYILHSLSISCIADHSQFSPSLFPSFTHSSQIPTTFTALRCSF